MLWHMINHVQWLHADYNTVHFLMVVAMTESAGSTLVDHIAHSNIMIAFTRIIDCNFTASTVFHQYQYLK